MPSCRSCPRCMTLNPVTICPYSGPKSFTWEAWTESEPEVGPTQSKFVDVAIVVAQAIAAAIRPWILALRRQPEDDEAAKRRKRNPRNQQEEETMRRFMVHLVTEIDFVDGDEASDVAAQNYQKHLKETIQNAARLSLHTIKDAHVESVSVAEIKAEL